MYSPDYDLETHGTSLHALHLCTSLLCIGLGLPLPVFDLGQLQTGVLVIMMNVETGSAQHAITVVIIAQAILFWACALGLLLLVGCPRP